ncbi:hypothetical protein GCM10027570_25200 [Streptomonospora sediminis]
MSAVVAVLDAANIAVYAKGRARFSRVAQVRELCRARWPQGDVHAYIDADVRYRVEDPERLTRALNERWVEVSAGDADDDVLAHAQRVGAVVVSNDKFADARNEHPWLQDTEHTRVFGASWLRGTPRLRPVTLTSLTAEQRERALRHKRFKTGEHSAADGRAFRCRAPREDCAYAGTVVEHWSIRWYQGEAFHACNHPVEEVGHRVAEPIAPADPTLSVMHGHRFQHSVQIGTAPVVFGRGGGDINTVAGLPEEQRRSISRRHIEFAADDDGQVLATHRSRTSASFLNPAFGTDGLPENNLLRDEEEYLLSPGDVVVLGRDAVRIRVE